MSLGNPGPVRWVRKGARLLAVSSPIPVHSAVIKRVSGDCYTFQLATVWGDAPVTVVSTLAEAKERAARMVNKAAYDDFKSGRFNAAQRYAMGQQQCPYWMKSHVCGQAPEPGTVWCGWHPNGKRREIR